MQIRAIIFDFNGVLVDDERLHCQAFQQVLTEENLELTWVEYCEKYLPYDDENFIKHYLRDRQVHFDQRHIRRLLDRKRQFYFKAIDKQVPFIDDSVEFIRKLPADILLTIASGAEKDEIEYILEQLELRDRFCRIIAAGDVTNGKPHPEAFLKAFESLKEADPALDQNEVIVIEDSYRAVETARAAGMKCIALATTYPAERLQAADLVLESLKGWTISDLQTRLS